MKENYAGKLTDAQKETTKPGYNSASVVNFNSKQSLMIFLHPRVVILCFLVSFKFEKTAFLPMFIEIWPDKFKEVKFNEDTVNAL